MARMKRKEGTGAVFTEGFTSISGLRTRGTVTGLPTLMDGPHEQPGTLLDGTNDYWIYGAPLNFNLSAFTVLVWVYVDSAGSGYRHVMDVGAARATIALNNVDNKIATWTNNGGAVLSTDEVPTDQWVLIAWVFKTNLTTIYINGVASGGGAEAQPTSARTSTTFGASNGGTLKMQGGIGEVQKFDRDLSAAEVLAVKEDTVFRYWESLVSRWDASDPNTKDLGFRKFGYDMTGVGLAASNIVRGPYSGKATNYDGSTEYSRRAEANWRSGDTQGSIVALVRLNAIGAYQEFFGSSDEAASDDSFGFQVSNGNNLRVYTKIAGSFDMVRGGTSLEADRWYLAGASSDGTGWSLYVDGVKEALAVVLGSDTGGWFGDVPNRDNITFGGVKQVAAGNYLNGMIAKMFCYSQNLLPIQHADLFARIKAGRE